MHRLGRVLGDTTLGYGLGRGISLGQEFIAAHEFRSPLLFQFEPGRLNAGIPLDQLKLQNPVLKKTSNQTQPVSQGYRYRESEPDPGMLLNRKIRALEGAQKDAVKVEQLPDGRIRYYDDEVSQKTSGPTRGRAYVTEWNQKTGQVRSWMECYDQQGKVNRIHPKMIDGQNLDAQHYPPTKSEVEAVSKKPGGPK